MSRLSTRKGCARARSVAFASGGSSIRVLASFSTLAGGLPTMVWLRATVLYPTAGRDPSQQRDGVRVRQGAAAGGWGGVGVRDGVSAVMHEGTCDGPGPGAGVNDVLSKMRWV